MADDAEKKKADLYQSLVGKLKDQEYDEALDAADTLLSVVGVCCWHVSVRWWWWWWWSLMWSHSSQ